MYQQPLTISEEPLVVVGAWEVMDLQINSFLFKVNTVPADTMFKTQLQRGIDALRKQNVAVELLEKVWGPAR